MGLIMKDSMEYNMKDSIKNSMLLKINLSLFVGEKTEKATPKKRSKSRDEGQVAKSQEISTAFTYIVGFFSFQLFAMHILTGVTGVFHTVFNQWLMYENIQDAHFAADLLAYMFTQVLLIGAPLLAITLVFTIVVNLIQVGWNPTWKPVIPPKFNKINPISGLKRMFSLRSLMELVKSLLKITVIGLVVFFFLANEIENILLIMQMSVLNSITYIGSLLVRLGITIGAWFIFIAAIDYAFQKYKHEKDLRMSKQEKKDEFKQTEGDPQIKRAIRRRMQEAGMRRMMQGIPQADVIITNPTHYAVALSYDRESAATAPRVVAKGIDHLAKRIQTIGRENNIPLVENVQLARALYAAVEVGQEIPEELYKAVAEVLAYVYRLKNVA